MNYLLRDRNPFTSLRLKDISLFPNEAVKHAKTGINHQFRRPAIGGYRDEGWNITWD